MTDDPVRPDNRRTAEGAVAPAPRHRGATPRPVPPARRRPHQPAPEAQPPASPVDAMETARALLHRRVAAQAVQDAGIRDLIARALGDLARAGARSRTRGEHGA